ncbi:hypothetical protein D1641_00855 [Colidextribacter sp. OB.20]|nr:hypothetical protein [Colidextribacter sp. OB.20]
MMSNARVKLPPELDTMPRFQLEDCIVQAHLGSVDTWLVKKYIFDRTAQADLAAELGWTRCTVSAHLKRAFRHLTEIAENLYINHA